MEKIGLFPLKNVLFPESALPLHIFEKRYIELVTDCLAGNKPFGIVLKLSNHTYSIGCLAEITDVMKEYDDKRMDILVSGLSRFSTHEIEEHSESYRIAEIKPLADLDEDYDKALLKECIDLFNDMSDAIKSVQVEPIDLVTFSGNFPSFLIAQKAGFSLIQKQHFLEILSENERLMLLYNHLLRILPMVKEAEFLTQIIKNDGYYKPKHFK